MGLDLVKLLTSQVQRLDLGSLLLLRQPSHGHRWTLVAQFLGDLRPGEAVQEVAPLILDHRHLNAVEGDVGFEPGVGLGVALSRSIRSGAKLKLIRDRRFTESFS